MTSGLVRVAVCFVLGSRRRIIAHGMAEGQDLVGDGQRQPTLTPSLAHQLAEVLPGSVLNNHAMVEYARQSKGGVIGRKTY